jgi:hypothetical protein
MPACGTKTPSIRDRIPIVQVPKIAFVNRLVVIERKGTLVHRSPVIQRGIRTQAISVTKFGYPEVVPGPTATPNQDRVINLTIDVGDRWRTGTKLKNRGIGSQILAATRQKEQAKATKENRIAQSHRKNKKYNNRPFNLFYSKVLKSD